MPPTSPSLNLLISALALLISILAPDGHPVHALSQQSPALSSPESVDNSMESTDDGLQQQQQQPPSPPETAASIASNSPVGLAAAASAASNPISEALPPAPRPVLALSGPPQQLPAQASASASSQSQLHMQTQSGSTGTGFPGDYNPRGPLVKCAFLPVAFLDCNEPIDHRGNRTSRDELGHGCVRFGGSRYEDVERTRVICNVLPDIECHGDRSFLRGGYPCVRYTDHYFVTTLLYSILLGFLGMDRFCLGQTGTAVGKLLTMGGLGIWWLVDIVLLITNNLLPEDGSNWNVRV